MSDEERVVELRELFPVINHWTYLYNGAVHACPKPVSDAMRSFLEEWENGGEAAFFSGYETFCRLKEKFSALVGANERNIVITESTSAALNLAAQIIQPRPDQNVVVTDLAFLTAVNICAVTVGSGFRYNLPEVHAITAKYNTPLIVDAAQALGLIDYDVNNPHQNFVAGTASKWLMGPAGVGFLYLDDSFLEATPPSVGWLAAANADEWDVRNCRLHSGAMRFQGGIPNLAGVTGALAALEFLDEVGQDFIERRVHELTTYALEELEKIGVDIWTPRADNERAGIVFFRTPGEKTLHDRLKSEHVYCGRFLGGIRIDPNFYNTYEEIDRFLAIVRSHVANRKKN
jgi:selenocysteine lyase/cysteine desulfurase